MSKHKSGSAVGVAALVTGLVAGAAAIFFSDKKNRQNTAKAINTAGKEIKKVQAEIKRNPKAFAKKVEKQGAKLANQVVREASKELKKVQKPVAKALSTSRGPVKTKKTAKKSAR